MASVHIEDELLDEALELSGHSSKRAVVEEVLRAYVTRQKQLRITELFGTIDRDDDYDYKAQRRRR